MPSFKSPLFLLLGLFSMALVSQASASNYRNFHVAVYVRAYEVRKMKDPAWLRAQWDLVSSQVKIDKVYLETFRDGILVDDATLAAAKKFFESRGVEVAGGIAAVRNERNLFETFCYTQPAQREEFKRVVQATARNFDSFILDDFFFTTCTCDSCIAAKGNQSWTQFRLGLMTEVARDLVLADARAVNPRVKITIKFPNWYEHYQGSGYNLGTEPGMFDRIYTGTETRDPVMTGQHLQQYQSYEIFRYLENVAPGRNGGGWVDTGARGNADRYAEQLWDTMFAKAPEIMLFALNELTEPLQPYDRAPWQGQGTSFDYDRAVAAVPHGVTPTLACVAGQALTLADKVVGHLGNPVGVASYRPFNSLGEDYLHNVLGMCGIPVELYPKFPAAASVVLLTEDAKADPAIVAEIKAKLLAGGRVFITSGLLHALQDRGLGDIAELRCGERRAFVADFSYWGGEDRIAKPMLIPEVRYLTNNSWDILSARASGMGYPLVLQHAYNRGKLYVLTIPDNPLDLYRLPPNVLDRIRELVCSAMPARLEGPSKVAIFDYDNGAVVVQNFRDEPVAVRVHLANPTLPVRDALGGQTLPASTVQGQAVVGLDIPPHSIRVLTRG